jgi:hypothetical protein
MAAKNRQEVLLWPRLAAACLVGRPAAGDSSASIGQI